MSKEITTNNYVITVVNSKNHTIEKEYSFHGTEFQAKSLVRAMMFAAADDKEYTGYKFDDMAATLEYDVYYRSFICTQVDTDCDLSGLQPANVAPMYLQYAALVPGLDFGSRKELEDVIVGIKLMAEDE